MGALNLPLSLRATLLVLMVLFCSRPWTRRPMQTVYTLHMRSWQDTSVLAGEACRSGYLSASRKEFWRHIQTHSHGDLPVLADVIHAQDRVYAVFNVKDEANADGGAVNRPYSTRVPWEAGNWTVQFDNALFNSSVSDEATVQPARVLGQGLPGLRTVIVYTQLPSQFKQHPPARPLHVSLHMHLRTQERSYVANYTHVQFCLSPGNSTFRHLIAGTQIRHHSAHLVPEWVMYHHLQGFEHFYIYVDDDPALVQQHVAPLQQAGLVTVVNWHWPARYQGRFWFQQAIQNSCLLRARGNARWVALHDVDEFFQTMQPNTTVAEFLEERSGVEHLAAFEVKNMFFGSSSNPAIQAQHSASGRGLVLDTFRSRNYTVVPKRKKKLIVNPLSTNYVDVHTMADGGTVYTLNSTTEVRMCHYKVPHERTYEVTDNSMAAFADSVKGLQLVYLGSWVGQTHYPAEVQ